MSRRGATRRRRQRLRRWLARDHAPRKTTPGGVGTGTLTALAERPHWACVWQEPTSDCANAVLHSFWSYHATRELAAEAALDHTGAVVVDVTAKPSRRCLDSDSLDKHILAMRREAKAGQRARQARQAAADSLEL